MRAIAEGSCARSSRNSLKACGVTPARSCGLVGNIGTLTHLLVDLGGRRHCRRAFPTRRDDCSRDVGERDHPFERPALEKAVAESATEAVSGAQPVDDIS